MRFSLPSLVSIYCFGLIIVSALIPVTAQHHEQPQGTASLSVTPEAAARNLARARDYKPIVLIHHARASLGVKNKLTDPQLVAIKRTEECCIECITCNGLCANCGCCNHHNA